MDALCATPCVSLAVSSFDACSVDPSPQVQQQFAADQWQSMVAGCGGLTSAAGQQNTQDSHCDDSMVTILSMINAVCKSQAIFTATVYMEISDAICVHTGCPGGCNNSPPKSCSASCADAFMPFYGECGHALAAIDEQLEARLHGLYVMCDAAAAGNSAAGGGVMGGGGGH